MRHPVALITGASGMDFFYLASLLLSKDYIVVGLSRRNSTSNHERLQYIFNHPNLRLVSGDLTDFSSIERIIKQYQPDEFYNLAAMSHVRESFDIPITTAMITGVGALHCLEAIRLHKPDTKFYQASCYDSKTKLITTDGIKSYDKITKDDLVYSVNPQTRNLELVGIKKIIIQDYNGPMIKFKNRRIDLLVTPNHKMFFQNDNKTVVNYDAINIKSMLKYTGLSQLSTIMPKWIGKHTNIIYFKDHVNDLHIPTNCKSNLITHMESKDLLYLLGLYAGDGYLGSKVKAMVACSHEERNNVRDISGRYIPWPKNIKRHKITRDSNLVNFAVPENDKARCKLESLLNKYGIKYTKLSWGINFSSYTLAKILSQTGSIVYQKHIPKWALEFDSSLLKYLYEGLIDSDGCYPNNNGNKLGKEQFSTSSKFLMRDMIEVCYKTGRFVSVTQVMPQDVFFSKQNRYIRSKKSYRIYIAKKLTNKIYNKNISQMDYSGKIWCLELEKNHNFLVYRNGKVAFSGNSSEMFGNQITENGITILDENSSLIPRSPYGVAKCFLGDTKIYTQNGLIPIKKIQPGTMVWTHTGQLKKVIDIYKRKYKGEVINIRVSTSCGKATKNATFPQSNLQITATPEHPILTKRGWIQMSDINMEDEICIVASRCKNCDIKIPGNRNYCSHKCKSLYYYQDNDNREKTRQSAKERYKNNPVFQKPDAIKKRRQYTARFLQKQGRNYMEHYLDLLIQDCAPGFFKFVGDGQVCIDGYFPDWINHNKKAIIEFLGWGETLERRLKSFNKKENHLKSLGYSLLVLKGSEFREPNFIKEKVSQFVSDLGSVEFIYVKVKNIQKYNKQLESNVYNLEVEDDHSYIANGVVAHNCFAHQMTQVYRQAYNLFACCGILMNHEDCLRGEMFVTRKITKAVAQIHHRQIKKISFGNLDAKRDWGASRDYVQAMFLMLQQEQPDDYIVATGEAHSCREFLELSAKIAGVQNIYDYIDIDPTLYRPTEIDILIGDASKAKERLKWQPTIGFERLVHDMMLHDLSWFNPNLNEEQKLIQCRQLLGDALCLKI